MIKKMIKSGFFDEAFLVNYRNLALRMDKELRTGKSKWHEGDLPPFNHDADPWCDCPDSPTIYWQKIKITDLKFIKEEGDFKWTWGGNFFYRVKARKENGSWKITYLEGFDARHYKWATP